MTNSGNEFTLYDFLLSSEDTEDEDGLEWKDNFDGDEE
jgi:hypothetical protein